MHKALDKLFPLWHIRNIGLFYILYAAYNMWFVGGVWIFIWGRFMTKTQIGISDAFTFAVGFLFELPSGVLADLIGRRKAIFIGNVLLCIGNFLITFSSSFLSITLWYLIWTIGYAFQSGATEALAYDSLKKLGKEDQWPKVIGCAAVIGRTTSLLATAVGGLLFAAWFRLPYLIFAVSGIMGVLAAYFLKEIPVAHPASGWSVQTYLNQIKGGVSTLLNKKVFPISFISILVAGSAYIYNWGLLRPLTGERFGYTALTLPVLLAVGSLVVIGATFILVKFHSRFKLEKLLIFSALIFSLVYVLMGLPLGTVAGGIIMVCLAVAASWVEQLYSRFINAHTQPEHRATTLSAVALFTRLPYVLLAVLMGYLADKNLLSHFTIAIGLLLLLGWGISNRRYKLNHYV